MNVSGALSFVYEWDILIEVFLSLRGIIKGETDLHRHFHTRVFCDITKAGWLAASIYVGDIE